VLWVADVDFEACKGKPASGSWQSEFQIPDSAFYISNATPAAVSLTHSVGKDYIHRSNPARVGEA